MAPEDRQKRPLRKIARPAQRRAVEAPAPIAGQIARREPAETAPLSFAQERLWFLEQLTPGSALFNVPVAVHVRGPLDVAAFERCLVQIEQRHESLRTHFEERDGRPAQVISRHAGIRLEQIDLTSHPADTRNDEALRIANEEARKPFDLTGYPLWRASLLRLDEQHHFLVLVLHHGIAEGAGVATAFEELASLYGAQTRNQPSPLAALPIQYADFAVWQRQIAEKGDLSADVAYWEKQLQGLPTLQLPTDRPRPAVVNSEGSWRWIKLPAELRREVVSLAEQENVTLFITLLTAFNAFLCRYSRQEDIAVGAPISQRDRPELRGLIGFFVNTIVVRTDLSGDPSFRELLHRVRDVALDAYAHSAVPFKTLVEKLQPDRDASRNPMFQVMFELPTDPMPVLELPGLEPSRIMGPLELNTGTSKCDLAFFVWEEDGGLIAALEYDTDLFDGATIERMLANFETLLSGCVSQPDDKLSSQPLLSAGERQTVLAGWNRTAADFPAPRCAHELVQEQAADTPESLALASEDHQLTYGEWNRRANQLAHHLRQLEVGPGALVGVLMDHTPEMATALLATLKAGGAYVPLDPAQPPDRQAMMLEDAGAPVLLTQENLSDRLPETEATVVFVDRDWNEIAAHPDTDPEVNTGPEDLAYVIFTSGSTGRPKGVEVEHRALMNLVWWHRETYGVTPSDRATQLAGLAFDASVWELWPHLTAGASIHFPDADTRGEPARLLRWLAEREITLSFLPTPLAEAVLKEPCPPSMPLRAILTGGDRLRHPPPPGLPFELVNHYGPTENAVVATSTTVPPGTDRDPAPPIGRPIDNVTVYLLDSALEPVPIGTPGELHVGGASLARGYHGRPDLTQERFIDNPFEPGTRLYKTGDLARYLPDGNIDFLGRIDHQVKVRGFRIELGEIESVLGQDPRVRECVVLARDHAGTARLVGYIVPETGDAPTPAELRTFLLDKLPEYMVPTTYVSLEAFPITANGKIDRNALPEPEEQGASREEYVAPENEVQEKLAALWRELLGAEQVGIRDNLFEIGGHSMLIVKMQRRLNAEFQQQVSVADIFKFPTIAAMAQHLAGNAVQKSDGSDRAEKRRAASSRQRRRRDRRQR